MCGVPRSASIDELGQELAHRSRREEIVAALRMRRSPAGRRRTAGRARPAWPTSARTRRGSPATGWSAGPPAPASRRCRRTGSAPRRPCGTGLVGSLSSACSTASAINRGHCRSPRRPLAPVNAPVDPRGHRPGTARARAGARRATFHGVHPRRYACRPSACTRRPPRRRSSTSPVSPTSGRAARSSSATAPTSYLKVHDQGADRGRRHRGLGRRLGAPALRLVRSQPRRHDDDRLEHVGRRLRPHLHLHAQPRRDDRHRLRRRPRGQEPQGTVPRARPRSVGKSRLEKAFANSVKAVEAGNGGGIFLIRALRRVQASGSDSTTRRPSDRSRSLSMLSPSASSRADCACCAGRPSSSKKSARAGGNSLSAGSVTWST